MKLRYTDLGKHLQASHGQVSSVFAVTGEEDLLRELAINRIVDHILAGGLTPFNYEKFDGEECDHEAIINSANTLSMIGGRRVIVVKRAEQLLAKFPEVLGYVVDPSPDTVLLLEFSKSPDKRRKSWKELERKVTVVACETLDVAGVEKWVAEQAKGLDIQLGTNEVRYLISEFGTELRRLSKELEKMSLYATDATGERLDVDTISSVLGRSKAQSVFKFIDALAVGDSTKALRQLGLLLDEGEPPLRILSLIDRLVGQLRIANEFVCSRKTNKGELAQLLRIPRFAANNLSLSAKRFNRTKLDAAVVLVANTDLLIKSSSTSPRVALEKLAVSLCIN